MPAETIFFALQTHSNDGHQFIPDLIKKGVQTFVVDRKEIAEKYKDENLAIILVDHVLKALQQVSAYHRKKFDIPIMGITGSNGKTIVKEWLSYLLDDFQPICTSPLSYNSQIGVPLSVWNLNSEHNLGIFEAGISRPNEM